MGSKKQPILTRTINKKSREHDLPIDDFNEKIRHMQEFENLSETKEASLRLLRAKQVKGRAARTYCERKKMVASCLEADIMVLKRMKQLYFRERKRLREEIMMFARLQNNFELNENESKILE